MSKEEYAIPVHIGLGDVEVAANQGYQQRVKDVVDEFRKYFSPLAKVSLAGLVALQTWRFKPFDLGNLDSQHSSTRSKNLPMAKRVLTFNPCRTSCNEIVSKRRSLTKRSMFLRIFAWLCVCTSSMPQNSWGMIFDRTAWQNAETLDRDSASPVSDA